LIFAKESKGLNPVGRLDKETEGLLLFTNDGDLAYKLTHPKFNIDKVYKVTIIGQLKPETRSSLEKGIVLEGKRQQLARFLILEYLLIKQHCLLRFMKEESDKCDLCLGR